MSLIDSSRVESAIQRLEHLSPDTPARWGRMQALGMVEHLCNSLEIALGQRSVAPLAPMWLTPLLRAVGMLPFPTPRGLPSTGDFLAGRGKGFEEARQELATLLRRFHREVLANPAASHLHPVFGMMNRLQWAELQDRHLNHHFRQFGL